MNCAPLSFKENPKSGANVLSSTLLHHHPPFLALCSERFSRDTAVSFSQALLELSHGLTRRSLRRGKKRGEERGKRKISRGPAHAGILFTCVLLRVLATPR